MATIKMKVHKGHDEHKTTSQIIEDVIASSKGKGKIQVQEILDLLGEKSFALVILVLALPNCLPIPNVLAFSALTGIPIILFALQMAIGRETPWVPERMAKYQISRTKFVHMLKKILPYTQKIETVFTPRMIFLEMKTIERLAGIVFFMLAVVLSLPVPFDNLIPGFAISFIAIGLIVRDGLMLASGMVFGVGACLAMLTAMDAVFGVVMDLFG